VYVHKALSQKKLRAFFDLPTSHIKKNLENLAGDYNCQNSNTEKSGD
jgi:hypothetical protein